MTESANRQARSASEWFAAFERDPWGAKWTGILLPDNRDEYLIVEVYFDREEDAHVVRWHYRKEKQWTIARVPRALIEEIGPCEEDEGELCCNLVCSILGEAVGVHPDKLTWYNEREAAERTPRPATPPKSKEREKKQARREPGVYFIQARAPDGPIKIGVAVDVHDRVKALQTASPDELTLLDFIPGADASKEAALHGRFALYRIRGEWFRPAPQLLAYIETVRRENARNRGEQLRLKVA